MTRRAMVILVSAVMLQVACGGGSSSPTAPSASTPAPVTKVIGVSGNLAFGEVTVGASRTSTFTISNSGNTTLTVTGISVSGGLVSHSSASWTNGSVPAGGSQTVTVWFEPTAAGSYSGTVTVNADHTSGSNTLAISGTGVAATSFTGNWSGNYIVERCDGTGSLQDILCSAPSGSRPGGLYPVGTSLPMTISLVQNGNSVTGTFALGSVRGPATGTVVNGVLTLQGTASSGTLTGVISSWSTRVQGNVMTGSASYNMTITGAPGVGVLVTRLGTVTK
jgi:hypothetical protein